MNFITCSKACALKIDPSPTLQNQSSMAIFINSVNVYYRRTQLPSISVHDKESVLENINFSRITQA